MVVDDHNSVCSRAVRTGWWGRLRGDGHTGEYMCERDSLVNCVFGLFSLWI